MSDRGGQPCRPLNCPDCGRLSKDSWSGTYGTQNGTMHEWGGTCIKHGEWSDGT